MRIAWFSPLPPETSGIAAYSAEIAPLLASRVDALHLYVRTAWPPTDVDVEVAKRDDRLGRTRLTLAEIAPSLPGLSVESAHTFPWRHRRQPYDLVVYQLGNSPAHDYMWGYLFRYPGLLILHDAQVHQARALWLLRRLEPRLNHYLDELRANHPDAPAGVGHLFAAGLGGSLFRLWPLIGLAMRASKLTGVHNQHLAARLQREYRPAAVAHLDMGVADPCPGVLQSRDAGRRLRRSLGIADTACAIGAFGGVTPEKRIPQLLAAVAASPRRDLHVLLVGGRAGHYDIDAEVARLGLQERTHITGYVDDEALPAHLAAADICWCLRWPSNGETSASWLRCLAAGKPTLITALAQSHDVPALAVNEAGAAAVSTRVDAVAIAIDPLDERRDVALALEHLASDRSLREQLGAHARQHWAAHHTLPRMADAYMDLMAKAVSLPPPQVDLPPHLLDDGTTTARRILMASGVPELPW